MTVLDQLTNKRCTPCEGGTQPLSSEQIQTFLAALPHWQLTDDNKHIRRKWKCKDFQSALDFLVQIGRLAEEEQHHPDMHLTGYRQATIELTTHAIGGLSENDFIVAAKIDQLPGV